MQSFVAMVKNQFDKNVKVLRSDLNLSQDPCLSFIPKRALSIRLVVLIHLSRMEGSRILNVARTLHFQANLLL